MDLELKSINKKVTIEELRRKHITKIYFSISNFFNNEIINELINSNKEIIEIKDFVNFVNTNVITLLGELENIIILESVRDINKEDLNNLTGSDYSKLLNGIYEVNKNGFIFLFNNLKKIPIIKNLFQPKKE